MCVDTTPWGVSDYLANAPAVGLPASNFVPANLRSIAAGIAANSVPTKAPKTFVTACTGSLIARGIIYFKCSPGDCGSPTPLDLTDASLTGLAGNAAASGLSLASKLAGAASGVSAVAGAVLPGIGVAVQVLSQIFANHAAAVANEQTTICKVALLINQVIPFYDSAVRRGLIAPATAYAGMQSYIQQVIEQLDTIQKSCDAACVYIAILQAHFNFVEKYYPLIAPASIAAKAPGSAPVVQSAPGQPQQSGGAPGMVEDYFGKDVTLGAAFFSSTQGISMLPGVAGNYFTATELLGNPWGLTVNSPLSDGQYAQIQATPVGAWNGGGGAGGRGSRPSSGLFGLSTTDLVLVAAVLFVAFMLISGKKLL